LAGHEVGAGPLRDVKGAAYAMITMKGIIVEIFEISFFVDNCETRSWRGVLDTTLCDNVCQ